MYVVGFFPTPVFGSVSFELDWSPWRVPDLIQHLLCLKLLMDHVIIPQLYPPCLGPVGGHLVGEVTGCTGAALSTWITFFWGPALLLLLPHSVRASIVIG